MASSKLRLISLICGAGFNAAFDESVRGGGSNTNLKLQMISPTGIVSRFQLEKQ